MNENSNLSNHSSEEQQNRWFDLLIQRATTGLSDTEQHELDHLALSFDNQNEFDRFEATAAAFDLSISPIEYDVMPNDVHDLLLISAGKFLGEPSSQSAASAPTTSTAVDLPTVETKVELSKRRDSTASVRWREVFAITVTAACLLLMLSGFNPFSRTNDPPVASVLERMDQFVASKPADLVDVQWQPVHDKDAGGKVLWSDARQEGYMVFSGMDLNDPTVEQYQLWIFDNDPAQETPTDGGVFNISKSDVGPDGNVVVPIKASVPIGRAVQFAVTVETPGGVYVSDRKRLPVLAAINGPG